MKTLVACLTIAVLTSCAARKLPAPALSLVCDPAISINKVDAKYVEVHSPDSLQGVYLDYQALPLTGGAVGDLPLTSAIEDAGSAERLYHGLDRSRLPSTMHIASGDGLMAVAVTAATLGAGGLAMLVPAADVAQAEKRKLERGAVSSAAGEAGHGYLFFKRGQYSALELTASRCAPAATRLDCSQTLNGLVAGSSTCALQGLAKAPPPCDSAVTVVQCSW